jgi:hypothetical protein
MGAASKPAIQASSSDVMRASGSWLTVAPTLRAASRRGISVPRQAFSERGRTTKLGVFPGAASTADGSLPPTTSRSAVV